MPRIWTDEQRAAAAERIRASKPWEKSTGPRTSRGKKKSSQNAVKHGNDTNLIRTAHKALTLQSEFLRLINSVLPGEDFDAALQHANELHKNSHATNDLYH